MFLILYTPELMKFTYDCNENEAIVAKRGIKIIDRGVAKK